MSAASTHENPRKGSTPKILSHSFSAFANLVLRALMSRVGDAMQNMIVSRTRPENIKSIGAVQGEQSDNIYSQKGAPGPECQWWAGIGVADTASVRGTYLSPALIVGIKIP
jgi:hypothetical protein